MVDDSAEEKSIFSPVLEPLYMSSFKLAFYHNHILEELEALKARADADLQNEDPASWENPCGDHQVINVVPITL